MLLATHPAYVAHVAGEGHPERPERLAAVAKGVMDADLGEAVCPFEPRPARRDELTRVHAEDYVDALERFCAAGGGQLDPDTAVVAGLLRGGARWPPAPGSRPSSGSSAARPTPPSARCGRPGHHATAARAMGFCLFNNVAVAAAAPGRGRASGC